MFLKHFKCYIPSSNEVHKENLSRGHGEDRES